MVSGAGSSGDWLWCLAGPGVGASPLVVAFGHGTIDYWARESGVWFQPTGGWGQIPGQLAAGLG